MATVISERKPCPNCGKPMLPGVVEGLCPECLFAQGFGTEENGSTGLFEPPSVEEVQKLFPNLQVLALLGAGGMGAVYKAHQPSLGRNVALKILPGASKGGKKAEERFNREARALARLNHPNIVAVYEFGRAGDLHYFLMEFVDGANLRQINGNRELSPREAMQIVPQICDALQYAHDEGVVHRDIKPENVLLDRKGKVKIADFGLAKIAEQTSNDQRLTAEGQVMGTPHYMAPEQVERPLSVDHRADIYSLGVVFYELLTGDLPLGNFQPPSQKVRVDIRLDEVVLRALANDPERRYQHASEVKSRVENISSSPAQTRDNAANKKSYLRWAGFPVVVEFGGERAVNWNGALSALAVALLSMVPAFLLVHWVTGQGSIPGASHLSTLTAVLIVMFGIRRTLTRETQWNAPWWISQKLVFLFLPLFALAWSLFLAHLAEKRRVGITPAQIVHVNSGPMVAHLPGGKVELLAIGMPNGGPNGWWTPDGKPVREHRYEVPNPSKNERTGFAAKDVLIRYSDLPPNASLVGYKSIPFEGVSGGGRVLRDGKLLPGAFQARFTWKPSTTKADILCGFALEPWTTVAIQSPQGDRQQRFSNPSAPRRELQFHLRPEDTAGGAQIAVIFGPASEMWSYRVIAVDTNNVEVSANSEEGTPIGVVEDGFFIKRMMHKSFLTTYTFNNLQLSQLKEFKVQVRPVYWVQFSDIRLQPKTALPKYNGKEYSVPVSKQLAEGTVFDFDSGKSAELLGSTSNSNPLVGAGESVAWMSENGFDALIGIGQMEALEMDFAAYADEKWYTVTPEELTNDVYGKYYRPRVVRPDQYRVYGFRTRDNSVGLLKFLPANNGVAFEYKMVEP